VTRAICSAFASARRSIWFSSTLASTAPSAAMSTSESRLNWPSSERRRRRLRTSGLIDG
jgi:hypothetical protein